MAISGNSLDFLLSSPGETESFGNAIGRLLHGGEVLALIGELGVGKTALVRGIAAGAGIPAGTVTSPTFMIVHTYQGRLPLIHMDLYRLQKSHEIESIGLADYLADDCAVAIEWADRFPRWLPEDRLDVRIDHRTRRTRIIRLDARGPLARSLLARLSEVWHPAVRSSDLNSRTGRKASPP
ncbi:MAG: hypothetical protein A4E19_02575 [Nitrospira sp. SG-bin1]|nr:MAG: hypothetical protein A4E19_02575 [Nitrospira sp. SG-bin1]